MLRSTPPRPSCGALRVLRQLAFYGSFGTAAGATAFVLEEQRRQICRLSAIRDNGKKLRDFMRHSHGGASAQRSSGTEGFQGFVHSLESEGLLTSEPVSTQQELGVLKEQDGYHYFRTVRDHPRKRRRKRSSRMADGSADTLRKQTCSVTFVSAHQHRAVSNRATYCPLLLRPQSLHLIAPLSRRFSTAPVLPNVPNRLQRKEKKEKELDEVDSGTRLLDTFQAKISGCADDLDEGDLEVFLSATVRRTEWKTIELLLKTCRAQLPWSAHLYPLFLRSLAEADSTVNPRSGIACPVYNLLARIIKEGSISPATYLDCLHQAKAYRLLLAVYLHQQSTDQCEPDQVYIFLESALQLAATGSLETAPLSTLISANYRDPDFLKMLLRKSKSVSKQTETASSYYLTLFSSFRVACCHIESYEILFILREILEGCSGICHPNTLIEAAKEGATEQNCSPKWVSTMLTFCASLKFSHWDTRAHSNLRRLALVAYEKQSYEALLESQQRLGTEAHGPLSFRLLDFARLATAYLRVDKSFKSMIDGKTVEQLILECYRLGYDESVISLFQQYHSCSWFTSNAVYQSWQAVLRSASLEQAMDMLRVALDTPSSPSDLYLDSVQAALLKRHWKHTKHFHQVQGLYSNIIEMSTSAKKLPMATRTIITMIGICVETGRVDEALRLVAQFQDWGLTPNKDISYYLSLLPAKRGDWQKAIEMMDSTHSEISMRAPLREQSHSFTDFFQAFCMSHGATDAFWFFKRCIEVYGAVPDTLTFDHLLSSCLAVPENLDLVQEVMDFMRSNDLEWAVGAKTAAMAFKKYAREFRPDSLLFVRYLQDLVQQHHAFLSKDICFKVLENCSIESRQYKVKGNTATVAGFAGRLRENTEVHISQIQRLASISPWLSELTVPGTPRRPEHQFERMPQTHNAPGERARAFYVDMQIATSRGRPQEVLDIYEHAIARDSPRLQFMLEIAINACIQLGDLSKAHALIREAHLAGHDAFQASHILLMHRFKVERFSSDELNHLVFEHYQKMEMLNCPIRHDVTIAAATSLLFRTYREITDPAGALKLLKDAYNSAYAKETPPNVAFMSIFLAAYSYNKDIDGIRWTFERILSDKIRIDRHLFKTLHEARRSLHKALAQEGKDEEAKKVSVLFSVYDRLCWIRYREQRKEAGKVGANMVKLLVQLREESDGKQRRLHTNELRREASLRPKISLTRIKHERGHTGKG